MSAPGRSQALIPECEARRVVSDRRLSRREPAAAFVAGPLGAGRWPGRAWPGPAPRSRSRWPMPCARCSSAAIAERAPPKPTFANIEERLAHLRWLGAMSERLHKQKAELVDPRRVPRDALVRERARRARAGAGARPGPGRERLSQVRDLDRRRARLHAGDAVLGPADRRRRRRAPVPHADQPALRLRDPAPLPRPGEAATCSSRSAATTAAAAGRSIRTRCSARAAALGVPRRAERGLAAGLQALPGLRRCAPSTPSSASDPLDACRRPARRSSPAGDRTPAAAERRSRPSRSPRSCCAGAPG